MKLPDLFIFIDEVEDNRSFWKGAGPAVFYWCIAVPKWKVGIVQRKIREVVKNPGAFHAKDEYKVKSPNINVMRDLTDIIIACRLDCMCFPFFKGWLQAPRLRSLKDVDFTYWKLPIEDYRAVGFYFLAHVLNWCVPRYLAFQARMWLVADRGILGLDDKRKVLVGGAVLNMIDEIRINTRKLVPVLVLPDHLGHIFWKFSKQLTSDAGAKLEDNMSVSSATEEPVVQCKRIAVEGLFRGLSFGKWLDVQAVG